MFESVKCWQSVEMIMEDSLGLVITTTVLTLTVCPTTAHSSVLSHDHALPVVATVYNAAHLLCQWPSWLPLRAINYFYSDHCIADYSVCSNFEVADQIYNHTQGHIHDVKGFYNPPFNPAESCRKEKDVFRSIFTTGQAITQSIRLL